MGDKLRLSQCMIVKNEEKNIAQALSWGKDIMWEQIVVDTGSTDRTVEIAESMGAKVYHFSWIDDFAAAKNYALEQASGDWIAFLDADEYMTEDWTGKVFSMLEYQNNQKKYYAVRSPLICIDDAGNITQTSRHCRFFKRMPGLQYVGVIHEVLRLNGELIPEEYLYDTGAEFPVYHTGYQPEVMKEKGKNQRNIRILKKALEKQPKDYNLMGYLADSCSNDEGGIEEAKQWYQKAIALMPDVIHIRDERSASTFIYLLYILAYQGDEASFSQMYEKAIQYVPWVYDCDFIAGKFYRAKEDYQRTIYHLERALQIAEQYGTSAYGVYMSGEIAEVWEQLAWCYYEIGNLQVCVRYCVALLKADKNRTDALVVLLKALKKEQPTAIKSFLRNFYDTSLVSDRLLLLKALIQSESRAVLELLREECTSEELDFLKQMGY